MIVSTGFVVWKGAMGTSDAIALHGRLPVRDKVFNSCEVT